MLSTRNVSRRHRLVVFFIAVVFSIYYFSRSPTSKLVPRHVDSLKPYDPQRLLKSKPTNNYAFAAFLAAPSMNTKDDSDDLYFVGTRMLIYQLLHDPETRTNNSYPFVVLATQDVGMSHSLENATLENHS